MIKDNYTRRAVVRRVIDGDTIEVCVDGGYQRYSTERVRILRADTPEIRGAEREFGLISKKYVEEQLPVGSEIVLVSRKGDSFGRWLAEVYYINELGEQVNLSDVLLNNGLAELFE